MESCRHDGYVVTATVCQRVCRLFSCRSHTDQLEFANKSLQTLAFRVKAGLGFILKYLPSLSFTEEISALFSTYFYYKHAHILMELT